MAEKLLPHPKIIDIVEIQYDKAVIGKQFKQNAKLITSYLDSLSLEQLNSLEIEMNSSQK